MGRFGQQGDTRPIKPLKSSDYYSLKAAVQAERREPKHFPKCRTCKNTITGANYNGLCHDCFNENAVGYGHGGDSWNGAGALWDLGLWSA
jgi:hypothetical protein